MVIMIELTLICDEKKIFDGEISELSFTRDGETIAILPGHQPYMSSISGNITYVTSDGKKEESDNLSGFIYTNGTKSFAVVDKSV
jgi:F0F1-type ATP synthase epsilon subunit